MSRPPDEVNAAATPDYKAIPLQRLPRIVCGRCGGKAKQISHWEEWRYYACAESEPCVDPDTNKVQITKVLAT